MFGMNLLITLSIGMEFCLEAPDNIKHSLELILL